MKRSIRQKDEEIQSYIRRLKDGGGESKALSEELRQARERVSALESQIERMSSKIRSGDVMPEAAQSQV